MPILIHDISIGLDEPEDLLPQRAARRLRVPPSAVREWSIERRSLDARHKPNIVFVYNILATLADGPDFEARLVHRLRRQDVALATPPETFDPQPGNQPLPAPPIIIGLGPAGMFAALLLAEHGYAPIVLERGRPVEQRGRDVFERFYKAGQFDPESNLLFGEGGAGAYSDGKLYTRVHDPRTHVVYDTLVAAGADPDIRIDGKPHVGSDRLPAICAAIRRRIIEAGGQVHFGARVVDLVPAETGSIAQVVLTDGRRFDAGPVILATGHSARDVYRFLHRLRIALEAKPFQMGVRIQHPQDLVNRWQYDTLAGHPKLPPADYHLVAKGAAGQLGDAFSFCMCPGGSILPANESPGLIVTNGASPSRRDGPFANSGLVVTLRPETYARDLAADPADAALLGIEFQEKWESAAFALSGGYRVPAQRAGDFLAAKASDAPVSVDHPIGSVPADLRAVLPRELAEAIAKALRMLDRRLPGFAGPDAVLTAPETRASSPVRILRDTVTRASPSADNLYPVGEGAGYAGGIVSAAVDGIKSAEMIVLRYRPAT